MSTQGFAAFNPQTLASARQAPEAGPGTTACAMSAALSPAAVNAAVLAAESDLGPSWLLVNIAGWDKPAPFLATDKPVWDKIITINSAIEVDLDGQVHAEATPKGPISGPGGASDFAGGARAAGGLRLIVLPASAAGPVTVEAVDRAGNGAAVDHLVRFAHGVPFN